MSERLRDDKEKRTAGYEAFYESRRWLTRLAHLEGASVEHMLLWLLRAERRTKVSLEAGIFI